MWVGSHGSQRPGHEIEGRLGLRVWEENGYNFMSVCVCMSERERLHWPACGSRHLTALKTRHQFDQPYLHKDRKQSRTLKRWSLMHFKCSSAVFVYPQGFIYSRGPSTLGRWRGENDSCWWVVLRGAASPCLGSTWQIGRRTGPPYWPGTDWHMSGERGVKKREGEVSDTLICVIKSFLTAPPHLHQTDIKHLLQCPLLNPDSTATTCGHGQLDCLPSTVAHSGACANLESTQFWPRHPSWADHLLTNKLVYH